MILKEFLTFYATLGGTGFYFQDSNDNYREYSKDELLNLIENSTIIRLSVNNDNSYQTMLSMDILDINSNEHIEDRIGRFTMRTNMNQIYQNNIDRFNRTLKIDNFLE